MKNIIGIRVDIDFEIGMVKGVPYLLELFRENDIRASFFITMGPDGFTQNKSRLKSSGYIRRVISFSPFKIVTRFGLAYLIKQFLGFSGKVGASHLEILKRIAAEGHELGLHGYDHFWWAENIWNASMEEVRNDVDKCINTFMEMTDFEPSAWASPNWRCSENSLKLINEYDFLYGADCRGEFPFYPDINGWKGNKIQLPVTLPCLHEAKQFLRTRDHDKIINYLISYLKSDFNILCIHGYYEGILEREIFQKLLGKLFKKSFKLTTVKNLFELQDKGSVPVCELTSRKLRGGRGRVSCQGRRVSEK